MNILANDGVSEAGIKKLEAAGYNVITTKVAQEQLANYINDKDISVLLVRSATKVRKDIIDACEGLKMIGRGGVGLDNIDVAYAKEKGVKVVNTPSASSHSVAELVITHILNGSRHIHQSNREMPLEGETNFKALKKSYLGNEVYGKTLGIVGFGRIGHHVAQVALGMGMKVVISDVYFEDKIGKTLPVTLNFPGGQELEMKVEVVAMEDLLKTSDFVTLHVPSQDHYIIDKKELELMKDTAGLINAARGGVVNEEALDKALADKKLGFAGLDVFEGEPKPPVKLLMNPDISLSPHIGGSTREAQSRIGIELADQIIEEFGNQ